MNPHITKHLTQFDEEFLPEEVVYNPDKVKQFIQQALEETWNASRKDTVDELNRIATNAK